jgi:hypothetical protein
VIDSVSFPFTLTLLVDEAPFSRGALEKPIRTNVLVVAVLVVANIFQRKFGGIQWIGSRSQAIPRFPFSGPDCGFDTFSSSRRVLSAVGGPTVLGGAGHSIDPGAIEDDVAGLTPLPGEQPQPAKSLSLTDPTAALTSKGKSQIDFAYGTNYLIDTKAAIIVVVEASPRAGRRKSLQRA